MRGGQRGRNRESEGGRDGENKRERGRNREREGGGERGERDKRKVTGRQKVTG